MTMDVMWFFADEQHNIIAQTLMNYTHEEQAIDELSKHVSPGRYILGYIRPDGSQKIFENVRQIVS